MNAYDEDMKITKAYELLREAVLLEELSPEWVSFLREALEEMILDAGTH